MLRTGTRYRCSSISSARPDDPALALLDEIDDAPYLIRQGKICLDLLERLGDVELVVVDHAVGLFEAVDGLRGEIPASQPDEVEAVEGERFLSGEDVRGHVLRDPGPA